MSEKLDLVRSIYADWERGDFSSVAWAHSDIEFVPADGPDPGSWTGLAGIWEGRRTRLTAWEHHRIEVDEYRELDEERVLDLTQGVGHGQSSGLEMKQTQTKGRASSTSAMAR